MVESHSKWLAAVLVAVAFSIVPVMKTPFYTSTFG